MTSVEAARSAGWVFLGFGYWMATDLEAVANGYYPAVWWSEGARDLCLGHGIDFID